MDKPKFHPTDGSPVIVMPNGTCFTGLVTRYKLVMSKQKKEKEKKTKKKKDKGKQHRESDFDTVCCA